MPLIQTASLSPDSPLPSAVSHQVYGALDAAVTLEVHSELHHLRNRPPSIYDFERALQAPYLEIMNRGFPIDELSRHRACQELRARRENLQNLLNKLALAVWDRPLNPRSYQQLADFFYGSMKLPEVWIRQKGVSKLSTNREALEKLDVYLHARPFISLILGIRDISKQLDVFETEIDSDGRFRSSYNIAGTETGRPSSSQSALGTGSNAQNIAPSLRYVFCAEQGMKLGQIDLEQVEARDVGWFAGVLFGDWTFLDACEQGDLHSNNARRIWPELGWTGDRIADRAIADKNFYRDFSYRDMAKRGSHLCLTEDHEVLTPYGWEPISSKPSQIMIWDKTDSFFSEVTNWTDEEYDGELHEFTGNSVSALMTPNHRVPYITDQRNPVNVRVRLAEKGPGQFIPLGNGYIGGKEIVPARLIAAFMSDGYQASTNRMSFHLKKERKIERLKYLCGLYNFTFEHKGDKVSVHGNLPKRTTAQMFNWTSGCLRDFLDEYKYWDGHVSETAVCLFSVDREHMEWIQTFGRILGIGGSVRHSVTTTNFSNSSKTYITDYYTLQQNNRQWATGKSMKHSKILAKDIRVYCPTVSSGFFYIRRNGKISITGNSNYMGTAWTAARSLKVPIEIMEEFQARYIKGRSARPADLGSKTRNARPAEPPIIPAYPCIAQYWQWIAQEIQTTHSLTTPFGRQRHFFGRPGDDTTLREAIAFLPQSTTADRMNLGLWRVWKNMPQVQLLAQTYDSITFQYDEREEDRIMEEALALIQVNLEAPGRPRYVVPGEAKVGWNWGYQVTQADVDRARKAVRKVPRLNLDGLAKWKPGGDGRVRHVGLQRIMQ